jgi:hypothetical protein
MKIQEISKEFGDTLSWRQKGDLIDIVTECDIKLGAKKETLAPMMSFLYFDAAKLNDEDYRAMQKVSTQAFITEMAKRDGVELKFDPMECMGDISIRFAKSLSKRQTDLLTILLAYSLECGGTPENLAPFWVFLDIEKCEKHFGDLKSSCKYGNIFGKN